MPLLLVLLVDGARGARQTWPIALAVGATFAVAQFIASNYLSVELTDIIAALAGPRRRRRHAARSGPRRVVAEAAERLRIQSAEETARTGTRDRDQTTLGGVPAPAPRPTRTVEQAPPWPSGAPTPPDGCSWPSSRTCWSSPCSRWPSCGARLKNGLAATDSRSAGPGWTATSSAPRASPSRSTVYNFQWLSSPGTLLLICGFITALVYRCRWPGRSREFVATAVKLRFAFLTVASVLALAYVMNLSGQTLTIGTWIAGTGAFFAFLSPILGWLGTAVTGSDTSANALFATLQQTAAQKAGLDPTLLVAANTSGGVVGKMISPQNLTIAATAVGILGRESDLFRKTVLWSIGLLLLLCVLVYLQSTPCSAWMLP